MGAELTQPLARFLKDRLLILYQCVIGILRAQFDIQTIAMKLKPNLVPESTTNSFSASNSRRSSSRTAAG